MRNMSKCVKICTNICFWCSKQVYFHTLGYVMLFFLYANSEFSVKELLSNIEIQEKKINSLQVTFEQTIEFKLTLETHTIIADLSFQRPNRVYIKQYLPQERTIISNGSKIWVYDTGQKRIFIGRWKAWKDINDYLPGLLNPSSTVSDLKSKYFFEIVSIEDDYYVLLAKLLPKLRKKVKYFFDEEVKFYFWISKTDYLIYKTQLVSENVICTTQVRAWNINPVIESDLFNFKVPAGVEVIKIPEK